VDNECVVYVSELGNCSMRARCRQSVLHKHEWGSKL